MSARAISVLLLAAVPVLFPGRLTAQNLVPNSNFDSGISTNWTASNDGGCPGCSANPDNTNGYPTTPSARLASTTAGNAGEGLLSDCVAYSLTTMDLGVFEHQNVVDANALSQVFFSFFTDSGCTSFVESAPISDLGSPAAGWTQRGALNFVPTNASGFFNVFLQARLNGAGPGAGDFSYDHVYLGPPGTTPVRLLGFEAD